MRLLHIDPFAGVAGDMLLAALLDVGASFDEVERRVRLLELPGWRVEVDRERRDGFAGTRIVVRVDAESHTARHLTDVESCINGSSLPDRPRRLALEAFRRLFEAEAAVHGVPLDKAHLHEAGAVDAVVDIVGACVAVDLLDPARITSGPVPVGRGTVETAHGLLPVPPPAVARLLEGIPLAAHAADGEMTTPTGAALVTTLVEGFGPVPSGEILATGVGFGTRRFAGMPNMLRIFLLDAADEAPRGRTMALVESTVDDATGEHLAWVIDRLVKAGALDAWTLSGTGRKGRPVTELRCLVEPGDVAGVTAALFSAGTSLGVRVLECRRPELERVTLDVDTPFGTIPVKLGIFQGAVVSAKPEHDVCRATAERTGVALSVIEDAARRGAPGPGNPWGESRTTPGPQLK